ncbi:alpha-latroinsectotoxin-Lt1a-like [Parasteatoda tepidariorum]|uniref:alpha-latroinsectotoxin-Lt1a-like n=1 Tax=Parasteatoda tepidariorum TaxID=114398 RepID=UPI001C7193F3|nr:alpha-latroinsectotoxin-Lt1a-like [Parasteatoda tepidariorum]
MSSSVDKNIRALMRLTRDAELEQLAEKCKRLEKDTNAFDTFLGVAGAVGAIAGALVMPGLGVVMGGLMLGTSAVKGLLGDASIDRDCSDVPFKELEEKLNEKFSEVNRKLDEQMEVLKDISGKISETLTQLEITRREMRAGFELVLTKMDSQDINRNAAIITGASSAFATSEENKRNANKEQYINFIQQEIEGNILFEYIKQQGTLYGALYSIMGQNYVNPSGNNDKNAYNALVALSYGTVTYATIVFSLLDQYAYISEHYYQKNELDKFNRHVNKLSFYFTTFKSILGKQNGLIDKVTQLLSGAEKIYDAQSSMHQAIENQMTTLGALKQRVNDMVLPIISMTPRNDIEITFSTYEGPLNSNTDFLDWKNGGKVSYALQFESGGKYSKISNWITHDVISVANPNIELRSEHPMNRLVFRKFDNNPPELVRIVSGIQRIFRDVDRDLYNLPSKRSLNDAEVLNNMIILNQNLGASLAAVFENKRGVVHAAAENGRVSLLSHILQLDSSLIDLKDSVGFTPLHIASERKQIGVVNELIRLGANVNVQTDTYNLTPLHLAVRQQSDDIVEALLATASIDPNLKDKAGMTPLHLSVADTSFSLSICSKLLDSGKVDPNAKDASGLTPLHYSTILHLEYPLRRLLQTSNINKWPKDNNNMTPLHYAAMKGLDGLTEDLLTRNKRRINDAAGERMWTALHYAVFFKQPEFVVDLLETEGRERHIMVDVLDADMQTPLHLAAASGQQESVNVLLRNGAKVYKKTSKDQTPLNLAIIHGKKDVIVPLLNKEKEQRLEDNTRARDADTLACELAKGEILDLLVQRGRCTRQYRRDIEDSNKLTFDSKNKKPFVALNHNGNYVRDALHHLLDHPSKPSENLKVKESLKSVDLNGALLLLDLFVRKVTNEKYNSEWVHSGSPLWARARALNITESLGRIMESVGVRNEDLFDLHSKVYKAVLRGSKKELVSSLCSYLKDYSSLGPQQVEEFITAVLEDETVCN